MLAVSRYLSASLTTRSKNIVLAVGLSLSAVIVLPLLILLLSRGGAESSGTGGAVSSSVTASSGADFELRQLQQRAEELLARDLAEALRAGDVSLDLMARLNRSQDKADRALAAGDFERAASMYREVLERGEAELAELELAVQARELQERAYSELNRLAYLKRAFEQTYQYAVAQYDTGLASLESGDFGASVRAYEAALKVLAELEASGTVQISGFLELGDQALQDYDLSGARAAYEAALQIDGGNRSALAGLSAVADLAGIADAVPAVEALEQAGDLDQALVEWQRLATAHPDNSFLLERIAQVRAEILNRDYQALLKQVAAAEAAGQYQVAITALEAALDLKHSPEQVLRLESLRKLLQAAQLEHLLATGYAALQAGDFEAARNAYKESIALAPNSVEAQAGLEKASSLYLASIRFNQNLVSAAKYAEEGRFPLAAKFFNNAMASRPSTIGSKELAEEARLRELLELQSQEVAVVVESDKRTYVSIIGVLPPDRFRSTELQLFPDVYIIKGTRPGYAPVEVEFKVNAAQPSQVVEVICRKKL